MLFGRVPTYLPFFVQVTRKSIFLLLACWITSRNASYHMDVWTRFFGNKKIRKGSLNPCWMGTKSCTKPPWVIRVDLQVLINTVLKRFKNQFWYIITILKTFEILLVICTFKMTQLVVWCSLLDLNDVYDNVHLHNPSQLCGLPCAFGVTKKPSTTHHNMHV